MKKIDEMTVVVPDSLAPKPMEYGSIMTGLKRLSYRLSKANTPQKYLAAFDLASRLVNAFPLKSKMIWKAMRDGYVSLNAAPEVENTADVASMPEKPGAEYFENFG